jgi:ABC-type branched-subunit amino acid transport system ATPase component/branched-subunit amino acid ABC-type transport system permease component
MTIIALSRTRRRLLGAAGVLALWGLTVAFPVAWPRGLLLQGALFGASAGLLAVGLVLTYQTTRVINFSYGAMGACAAGVGTVAYQVHGLPWAVSVLLAVATGVGLGLVTDRVFRRFGNAPRLTVTVATVGLLQIFVGLQFAVSFWSGANPLIPRFSTGLSEHRRAIGTTPFTGNDLVAFGLVPIALGGLTWFLLRTEAGTAVRGLADNRERALLLGVPVRRLSRLTWILVGALAAAVFILNAPMNGVPISPFVATGGLFLPALAAAVIAKMEELSVAFASGVVLGVFTAAVSNNVNKTALSTVAMLVVILAALLLRRWRLSRAELAETSWALSGARRPLPPEVARIPVVRYGRIAAVGLVLAAALAFPIWSGPAQLHTMSGHVILAMAVISLVVLAGWAGSVSLGQFAIVGVGAVAAGNAMAKLNLDLFLVLVLAALAGAAMSLVVGLPALRVRPLFLAVTTLTFAAAMDQYFLNPSNYPDWIPARIIRPDLWQRFPLESSRTMYYFCVGALVFVVVVASMLRRARPGRVLLASRDNEQAASAMAVSVTRVRLAGMAVAGMVAGVAGALHVFLELGIGTSAFPAQTSVLVFSIAVVGGLSSISGALLGVAAVQLLIFAIGQLTSAGVQFGELGTGLLLLGVLLLFPGGLGEAIDQLRDAIARPIARRHGIGFEVGAAAGSIGVSPTSAPSVRDTAIAAPADAPTVLRCQQLTASYGPLQVLFGVDLEVREGEVVALLGTNGAGKSTIFKAVTGLLPPSGGSVQLDGAEVGHRQTDAIARLGLSMMPGGRGVFPTLTVEENLRLACWQIADKEAARDARDEMRAMFPILASRSGTQAGNLSGGEQQQLSLAMAFITRPRILLIDELSLGLAPTVVAMLCEKVAEIHRAGTTVVVVEQSVNVALQLAERAVFLEKGTVRFEGPTTELLDRPDLLRSVFIGGGAPSGHGAAPAAAPEAALPPRAPAEQRDVRLVVEDVVKRFGGITALHKVNLEIEPGTVVGLIGHNGAGKTTLFDVISGFQEADEGRILLGGQDLTRRAPHQRAVGGLGRSFQEARLYPSLTVLETVVVALDQHLDSRGWVAAGLALPASVDAEYRAFARAAEIVGMLGLDGYAATPIKDLSTGTRRIVELACVLAADPAVILLDEPTAGVAQRDTEALGPLLRRVKDQTGSAIVIIEHDMALLTSLCDELVALELGSVICRGTPEEVLSHPDVIESYLGTDEAAIHRSGPTIARDPRGQRTTAGSGRRPPPLRASTRG